MSTNNRDHEFGLGSQGNKRPKYEKHRMSTSYLSHMTITLL